MLLKRTYEPKYALVPNVFIEKYMKDIQGDILKVYLWLLRLSERQWEDISVAYIADRLDCMEKDVRRALTILEKQGILRLEYEDSQISGIVLAGLDEKEENAFDDGGSGNNASSAGSHGNNASKGNALNGNVSAGNALDGKALAGNTLAGNASAGNALDGNASDGSASDGSVSDGTGFPDDARKDEAADGSDAADGRQIEAGYHDDEAGDGVNGEYSHDEQSISEEDDTYQQFEISSDPEYRYMVIAIERYLGRTLTSTDISLFDRLHKEYDFSYELIEYLVEYCVELGKKSIRYIETVALSWARDGKMSVAELKEESKAFRKENRAVMKAFGITGRVLGDKERSFVDKWLKEQHFNLDVVIEACDNTMTAIQGPSFEYTDKILSEWKKAGVVTVEDARKVSEEYKKAAAQQYGKGSGNKGASSRGGASGNTGAPNRFHNFEQRKIDYDALLADEIGLKKRKKAKPKNGPGERPDEKADEKSDNGVVS